MIYAIIAAGGKGKRFQNPISKQLVLLKDRPLLCWTLKPFHQERSIDRIIVAYPVDEPESDYRKILEQESFTKVELVKGGETRFQSVYHAFDSIDGAASDDLVVVHDGVRPLLSPTLLKRLLDTASKKGTALPVLPIQDTLKEVVDRRFVRTIPRHGLFVAQTPQVFRYHILQAAYNTAPESFNPDWFTDESMLVELAGHSIEVVEGEKQNLKVTEPEDLGLAEYYLNRGWS
jgi:2-C-methyl-D-erythritol 4-phosphate cytidylyltransferase